MGFHPDADAGTAKSAAVANELFEERVRQQIVEPYVPEHDDQYIDGQLERAAATYVDYAKNEGSFRAARRYQEANRAPATWPWQNRFWKPSDRRRMLVKAGALIIAAIERLDRKAAT